MRDSVFELERTSEVCTQVSHPTEEFSSSHCWPSNLAQCPDVPVFLPFVGQCSVWQFWSLERVVFFFFPVSASSLLLWVFSVSRKSDRIQALITPHAEVKEGSWVGWRVPNLLRMSMKLFSFSLITNYHRDLWNPLSRLMLKSFKDLFFMVSYSVSIIGRLLFGY